MGPFFATIHLLSCSLQHTCWFSGIMPVTGLFVILHFDFTDSVFSHACLGCCLVLLHSFSCSYCVGSSKSGFLCNELVWFCAFLSSNCFSYCLFRCRFCVSSAEGTRWFPIRKRLRIWSSSLLYLFWFVGYICVSSEKRYC